MVDKPEIKLAKKMIISMGAVICLVGIYGTLSPEPLQELLGLDNETTHILSGILIFVGCVDIFIIPKLLDKTLGKNKK